MLKKLNDNGNIQQIKSEQAKKLIKEQQDVLLLLKSRHCKGECVFLNAYDRLFRHITVWLLQRNYNLTSVNPHQTLLSVCSLFANRDDIKKMIHTRHQLKKTLINKTMIPNTDIELLDRLLSHFNDSYQ